MLSLDDERWKDLSGGYRIPFDPRPLLLKLESNAHTQDVWDELWADLHHQGDVGEASYAAIPHLVRIYSNHGALDWNTYAMVGIIELARDQGTNPDVPNWLKEDYFKAIEELARIGCREIVAAQDLDDIRAILGILALAKGARTHARFLLHYSEEELTGLEKRAIESDD